jgi:aspartate/methionine/tyrosine aminotransferase
VRVHGGSRLPIIHLGWHRILDAAIWANSYTPKASRPLLNVSQGVPAAPPPPELLTALGESASDGASAGYTVPSGLPALADALAVEMRRVYGRPDKEADVNADDLAITAGCNLAYAAAVQALCDAGDEIILPVPWYFNHQFVVLSWYS